MRGRVIAHAHGRRLSCPAVDLGAGGLAFVGSSEDIRGQHIHIDFDLGEIDAGRISAEGLVVGQSRRQGRCVWGVQFLHMHPRVAGVLRRYVDWRLGYAPRPLFESVGNVSPVRDAPASKARPRRPTWVPPGMVRGRYKSH